MILKSSRLHLIPSDLDLEVVVKMLGFHLTVRVTDLQLFTPLMIRAELVPNRDPYVSVLWLQFDHPQIDITIETRRGIHLTGIPVINRTIKRIITKEIVELMVAPKELEIDIAYMLNYGHWRADAQNSNWIAPEMPESGNPGRLESPIVTGKRARIKQALRGVYHRFRRSDDDEDGSDEEVLPKEKTTQLEPMLADDDAGPHDRTKTSGTYRTFFRKKT